jgi:hypothetical protein
VPSQLPPRTVLMTAVAALREKLMALQADLRRQAPIG